MTPYIEKVQGMFLFLLTTAENHDPSKSVIILKLRKRTIYSKKVFDFNKTFQWKLFNCCNKITLYSKTII